MSSVEENIEIVKKPSGLKVVSANKPKKKRKFLRNIFLSLCLLFLVFLIFIQTSFFKNWLLQFGVDKVNEILIVKDSRLFIEKMEGSVLKDIKLYNISLTVKKDTMIKISMLDIEYGLPGLLKKEVKVKNLIIENPQINFTKIKDNNDSLIWNIEYLLKSDKVKEEDTIKSEFDWKIYADNFELKNGAFRSIEFKDSKLPIRDIVVKTMLNITSSELDVTELNIKLNAIYLPEEKSVNVQNISFKTNSSFNVQNLSLSASINKDDFAEVEI